MFLVHIGHTIRTENKDKTPIRANDKKLIFKIKGDSIIIRILFFLNSSDTCNVMASYD